MKQDLAAMMEKGTKQKGGWGNWFGYVLLPFKIALRDDPLDYVKEAKATVDRKKRTFEALITMMLAEVLVKLFGAKVYAYSNSIKFSELRYSEFFSSYLKNKYIHIA